jgi:maltooligosyltrehalose trehalohydrolase
MEPPDPQDEATFNSSKINWSKRESGYYGLMNEWTRKLVSIRRSDPALQNFNKDSLEINLIGEKGFTLSRLSEDYRSHLLCLFNLSDDSYTLRNYKSVIKT